MACRAGTSVSLRQTRHSIPSHLEGRIECSRNNHLLLSHERGGRLVTFFFLFVPKITTLPPTEEPLLQRHALGHRYGWDMPFFSFCLLVGTGIEMRSIDGLGHAPAFWIEADCSAAHSRRYERKKLLDL
jgi:hypothetical protein